MHHIDVPRGALQRDRRIFRPARGRRADRETTTNRIKPATGNIQKLSMLSHGNATSRAPICSGITKLPKPPVTSGIMTSHTITVPCIVEHLL